MKKILLIAAMAITLATNAQLYTTPSGGNKRASVSEGIGITTITIHYSRPGVKGREGKIWGQLVPEGFIDQNFGPSKAAPWRAGANENTTFECSTDITIEDKLLPAGKYGFFIAYGKEECTLIFSKENTAWGSFYYDEKKDALRVKVKPIPLEKSTEWLKYEFTNQTDTSASVNLTWEKLSIPFTVKVDLLKTQVESFEKELRTEKSYTGWQPWQEAAQWCASHNTNLQEALLWADTACNPNVLGELNFTTLSTKAQLLNKLGRAQEAASVMQQALPLGRMQEIHAYARQLLQQKKEKEAYDAFKLNAEKYPNTFTTNMGMVRGLSAIGKYKEALEYAEKALPLAPDANNKANLQAIIAKLKAGKDVN